MNVPLTARIFSKHFLVEDNEILPVEKTVIATEPNQNGSRQRILVVDDNNEARQLKINLLARSSYEVDGVNDGAYGWAALQVKQYDLVITDNTMPRMTGVEMIEKIRAARMAVLVIMATGFMPIFEFNRKPWLKPDGALVIPFSDDVLLWLVAKTLNKDKNDGGSKNTSRPKF
jgi:DNA-binding NtrC family response regulator